MKNVTEKHASIVTNCSLVRLALEKILGELEFDYIAVDRVFDVPANTNLVLASFSSIEALIDGSKTLLEHVNQPRIVLFPQDPDLMDALPPLPPQVAAVVTPNMSQIEITSIISLVAEGHRVIPYAADTGHVETIAASKPSVCPSVLTNRQLEILKEVAKGESNKAIARRFSISINTVEAHVSKIIRKLDVDNRIQAALALQHLPEDLGPDDPKEATSTEVKCIAAREDRAVAVGSGKVLQFDF